MTTCPHCKAPHMYREDRLSPTSAEEMVVYDICICGERVDPVILLNRQLQEEVKS